MLTADITLRGEKILYGHNERLGEENIFALIFGDEGLVP